MLEPPVATVEGAARFLSEHLGRDVGDVELVGEGEWSRCFGFQNRGRDLVVRFGRHLDDFERDRRAAAYAGPALPIPEVLEIGPALDGWFAISSRARGEPIEMADQASWNAVLPALRRTLDAMREVDVAATHGYGSWDATGTASYESWRGFLLAVGDDDPQHRTHGWRQRLIDSPVGDAPFDAGMARLAELSDSLVVERHPVHGDLINRNVLIDGERITGVFDWGCSIYGDPLYELALLQFWAPWHPNIDVAPVVDLAAGHDDRLRCCLIHIGLQHQGYCAWLGRFDDLRRITEQTLALLD